MQCDPFGETEQHFNKVVTRQLTLKTDVILESWATSGEYSSVISSDGLRCNCESAGPSSTSLGRFTERSQVRIEQFPEFSFVHDARPLQHDAALFEQQ
jgi:hypothetical protein